MRAVNLIPADSRAGGSRSRGPSTGMQIPVYVLLGFLAAAVALVTVYVLTNNSIAARTAKLGNLKTEVTQEQAAVARLGEFTKFASLAQTRISTVHSIAAARFDWHTALSDLAKVVPANTTLQSIVGTVVPGASSGGSGGAGTGSLRSGITAPAFELSGCTASQDDVAKLMSQLRLINGVTRVTISDSQIVEHRDRGVGRRLFPGLRRQRADLRPRRVLPARGERRTGRRDLGRGHHQHHDHHRRDPVTTRDRIVIMVVLALGAVVAGWMLVVSPKRDQAATLSTQISAQQTQLDSARSQLAAGETARSAFAGQYAELAKLGEAVPPDDDVPSLIYQVQNAAHGAKVSFRGLQLTSASGASTTTAPAPSTTTPSTSGSTGTPATGTTRPPAPRRRRPQLPPGAAVGAAGLPTEQFTFTLSGNFFHLADFFNRLQNFVTSRGSTPADQRPPHDHQRDQPRSGRHRVPPDHRKRLGDDLHRPGERGHVRWRHAGRPRHRAAGAGFHVLVLDRRARRRHHLTPPMSVLSNMIKELLERKLWPIAIGLIVALVAVPVLLSKKAPTDLRHRSRLGGAALFDRERAARDLGARPQPAQLQARRPRPQSVHPAARATTTTTTTTSTTTTTAAVSTPASGGPAPPGPPARHVSSSGGSDDRHPRHDFPRHHAGADLDHADDADQACAQACADRADRHADLPGLARHHDLGRRASTRSTRSSGSACLSEPEAADARRARRAPGRRTACCSPSSREPSSAAPGHAPRVRSTARSSSLDPGQTEGVSKQTASGSTPVALFSVNSISRRPVPFGSHREQGSRDGVGGRPPAGSTNTSLSSVSLFQYDLSVGAVVDLRNLTVGG